MVRDGVTLRRAFELHPEYLTERISDGHDDPSAQPVNFADLGLQLTRASRAIKVWLAIETFGLDAFRAVIDRAIDLTLDAQAWIQADPRLELVSEASLGVLTFRRRGAPGEAPDSVDRRNEAMSQALAADGDVLLTSTVIGGRYVIRLCVLNHTSGPEDVRYALERVASAEAPDGSVPDPGGERATRQASLVKRSVDGEAFAAHDLRQIPGFEAVPDDAAARLLAAGRVERFAAGVAVTERWALARTFYLVLDGCLSVVIDGAEVNRLDSGDHFGEIAAIDWGRDFSYGRTATVIAETPSTLLAVPAAALRELMADVPEVDRAMRRVAQARLLTR